MLNPFPDLLILSLLAPTLLRVALGLLFLQSAWLHFWPETRARIVSDLSGFRLNVFGRNIVWYYVAAEVIIGVMLIIGLYTQIAALLALIGAIKLIYFRNRFPSLSEKPVAYHLLVIAVSASLMLSGAGAIAIDLPL